jgi:hypothetical protein
MIEVSKIENEIEEYYQVVFFPIKILDNTANRASARRI